MREKGGERQPDFNIKQARPQKVGNILAETSGIESVCQTSMEEECFKE